MKRRSKIIVGIVIVFLLAALACCVAVNTSTLAGLCGAAGLDMDNVDRIEFIKNREAQEIWVAEDFDTRYDMCEFLNSARCVRSLTPHASGGGMTVKVYLKEPQYGIEHIEVHMQSDNIVSGSRFTGANALLTNYRIISGGRSSEEWDAILERCEKIR